jgi:endoglycosylceramidase
MSGRPQLRREGRWLVDGLNRVVLLHGVNMVWKQAPFVPPATDEGFAERDADWMAAHGFNSARIGTLWSGVMPHGNEIDGTYLEAWDRVVQLLASRQIWTLFDFHQDLLGSRYGGEGVPDWVVERLSGHFDRWFGQPTRGFPFNYFTPQVSRAFDKLWRDRGEIRDGFRSAWAAVARRWKDQPYSMGYDLFNEPWAGMRYPQCLVPGVGYPQHDAKRLQPFFEHALAGIRAEDPHNLVWFQSQPLISVGAPTGFNAVPNERQLGYSFHYYCPVTTLASAAQDGKPRGPSLASACRFFGPRVFTYAQQQAKRMDSVELLTEFGATDQLDVLRQVVELADARLVGWQYWQYKNWRDPTTESQASGAQSLFADDADLSTVKRDKLRVLVRTYPQATAGVPLALSFDCDSGEFGYRYQARAAGGQTEIYVPVALHYADGYRVETQGARVVSRPNAPELLLCNDSESGEVTVKVRRA